MKREFKKILIIGSGALKIGEAGEFDYSGSQALKALKEEGIHTIVINPNIATVQTSKNIADTIYLLPVTPYFVEKVIAKERPDGILVTFGGQTALNCAVELEKAKVFETYNVEVLGTPISTIEMTEDRQAFAEALKEIHVKTARSRAVTTVEDALKAGEEIGLPVIVRAAFTLGGLGSGFAYTMDELRILAMKALAASPQILVDESLKGWKEVEYEVVRDEENNCITVCNMENFDPIGIHTGESVVVAPSQTLTNNEYHNLRQLAIKIIRHLGVIGECNVQYALDPHSEDYRVIEVNARLSRSSALASKATGYPLAFVAAKLGLGYALHELKNGVTGTTSAFFEPALDYVVVKLPRWDLDKFSNVNRELGSSMKSVGEVMAIGRNFEEAVQKGLRMLDIGTEGFEAWNPVRDDRIEDELAAPTDTRLTVIAHAFHMGYTVDRIHDLTKIDKWFLQRLQNIDSVKRKLQMLEGIHDLSEELMYNAKRLGFSDRQITYHVIKKLGNAHQMVVRNIRKGMGITPVVKQIDTTSGEYPAVTNYLYVTYAGSEHDVTFDNNSTVVLGSGVYRIGSSVEFDWCCINAMEALENHGKETIVINYNPETVSTDYDMSSKLYFEELSFERVMDILDLEQPEGVVVSMGGQIPNNLALKLYKQGAPILGTSPNMIDQVENRHLFSQALDDLDIDQPAWKELSNFESIYSFVEEVGYPVLIRPSYVLSGAAMRVVYNVEELEQCLQNAQDVSPDHPVVVSQFIEDAKEIELDAVAHQGKIATYAISEHVEQAGVHSGDATMYFPTQTVSDQEKKAIVDVAAKIASRFEINGPFNIQFLLKPTMLKVIECNMRASRSFPFVSKVANFNLVHQAVKGFITPYEVAEPVDIAKDLTHIGVKASQFSFTRLAGADPLLSVDMSSTGEVGCIGYSKEEALLKALLSVKMDLPKKGVLISSGHPSSKAFLLESVKMLAALGIPIYATGGTHNHLNENGITNTRLYWPDETESPNTMEYLASKNVDLVINIPKNRTLQELGNDYLIRRAAVDYSISLITNTQLADAFLRSFVEVDKDKLEIKAIAEYE